VVEKEDRMDLVVELGIKEHLDNQIRNRWGLK